MSTRKVAAIIGVGGLGMAIARRIANGRKLVLADFSSKNLQSAAETLRQAGHEVETHVVDVSKNGQVIAFAEAVSGSGLVDAIVHTAGLSTIQAAPRQILEVDLLGTANFLEAFYPLATPGLSVVCIASLAGHLGTFSSDLEHHLGTAPLEQLLDHPEIQSAPDASAYSLSKRGNILRVQAVSKAWGLKGARINSVSPGVVYTPMSQEEFESDQGAFMHSVVESSALARAGTADEIANVVAFLLSPESSFISGSDILVDGGEFAGQRWGKNGSR